MRFRKSVMFIFVLVFIFGLSGVVSAECSPVDAPSSCSNANECDDADFYWYDGICNGEVSSDGCQFGSCDECNDGGETKCNDAECAWWMSDETCHDKPNCVDDGGFNCMQESVDCAGLGGEVKSDFECVTSSQICCTEPAPVCEDLGGVICGSGESCSGTPEISLEGDCCIEPSVCEEDEDFVDSEVVIVTHESLPGVECSTINPDYENADFFEDVDGSGVYLCLKKETYGDSESYVVDSGVYLWSEESGYNCPGGVGEDSGRFKVINKAGDEDDAFLCVEYADKGEQTNLLITDMEFSTVGCSSGTWIQTSEQLDLGLSEPLVHCIRYLGEDLGGCDTDALDLCLKPGQCRGIEWWWDWTSAPHCKSGPPGECGPEENLKYCDCDDGPDGLSCSCEEEGGVWMENVEGGFYECLPFSEKCELTNLRWMWKNPDEVFVTLEPSDMVEGDDTVLMVADRSSGCEANDGTSMVITYEIWEDDRFFNDFVDLYTATADGEYHPSTTGPGIYVGSWSVQWKDLWWENLDFLNPNRDNNPDYLFIAKTPDGGEFGPSNTFIAVEAGSLHCSSNGDCNSGEICNSNNLCEDASGSEGMREMKLSAFDFDEDNKPLPLVNMIIREGENGPEHLDSPFQTVSTGKTAKINVECDDGGVGAIEYWVIASALGYESQTRFISVPCVPAGEEYSVYEDVADTEFYMSATGGSMLCGNEEVDSGEECDDGKHCDDGSSCITVNDCPGASGSCKVRSGDGCSASCEDEGESRAVVARVFDDDSGAIIEGARVKIREAKNQPDFYNELTDDDGFTSVYAQLVMEREYWFEVTHDGYLPIGRDEYIDHTDQSPLEPLVLPFDLIKGDTRDVIIQITVEGDGIENVEITVREEDENGKIIGEANRVTDKDGEVLYDDELVVGHYYIEINAEDLGYENIEGSFVVTAGEGTLTKTWEIGGYSFVGTSVGWIPGFDCSGNQFAIGVKVGVWFAGPETSCANFERMPDMISVDAGTTQLITIPWEGANPIGTFKCPTTHAATGGVAPYWLQSGHLECSKLQVNSEDAGWTPGTETLVSFGNECNIAEGWVAVGLELNGQDQVYCAQIEMSS